MNSEPDQQPEQQHKQPEIKLVNKGFIYLFFEIIYKIISSIVKTILAYKILRIISSFTLILLIYWYVMTKFI